MVDEGLDVGVDQAHELFFGLSSPFVKVLNAERGYSNVVLVPWDAEHKRKISYVMPKNKMIKATPADEEQAFLRFAPGVGYTVRSRQIAPTLPFGACFNTLIQYELWATGAASCHLRASLSIDFLKKTMAKTMLVNGIKKGGKEALEANVACLRKFIKEHPTAGTPAAGAEAAAGGGGGGGSGSAEVASAGPSVARQASGGGAAPPAAVCASFELRSTTSGPLAWREILEFSEHLENLELPTLLGVLMVVLLDVRDYMARLASVDEDSIWLGWPQFREAGQLKHIRMCTMKLLAVAEECSTRVQTWPVGAPDSPQAVANRTIAEQTLAFLQRHRPFIRSCAQHAELPEIHGVLYAIGEDELGNELAFVAMWAGMVDKALSSGRPDICRDIFQKLPPDLRCPAKDELVVTVRQSYLEDLLLALAINEPRAAHAALKAIRRFSFARSLHDLMALLELGDLEDYDSSAPQPDRDTFFAPLGGLFGSAKACFQKV